ncbi:MAG: MucR family transcriptional regulator [Alphaproteobacteria bacterium]
MSTQTEIKVSHEDMQRMAAEIVSAYVSNNAVRVAQVPEVVETVYHSLLKLRTPAPEPLKPAASVRRSVTPAYIICMEDGKKYRALKRHLQSQHGMTPLEYRAKWGLPADYPMVAPNYSAARSEMAKKTGLGRKASKPAPRRGRKRKAT